MGKLIAIDDGHGMETPGKRTPSLPGTTEYMHENEFNRAVAGYLKTHLERNGFSTLMVAAGDTDVPLRTRTDAANNAKADFFISIHANALNGIWGQQQGVSTYYLPNSDKGHTAAVLLHRQLVQGTRQKDRGVLTANFFVLRETTMTAVLCECAFMDNIDEAKLLMTDQFRRECAVEICKGICDFFGTPYVTENNTSEFEIDLKKICDLAGINYSYWSTKKNIDKYFSDFIHKISKKMEG